MEEPLQKPISEDSEKSGAKPDSSHVSEKNEGMKKVSHISENTEDKIHEMIKEETSLPEDELLLEDEGDFFWIFQKVVWGVVKTVVVVGGVIFLLWLIWQPTKDKVEKVFPEKETTQEKKVQKEIPAKSKPTGAQEKKTEPATDIVPQNSAYNSALWAQWLEDMRVYQITDTISQSILWMRDASAFFQVPLYDMVHAEDRTMREERVDVVLESLFKLIEESSFLQGELTSEIAEFAPRTSIAGDQASAQYQLFQKSIQSLQPETAVSSLKQKISAEKDFVSASSEVQARQLVLKLMQQYDPVLKNLYDNLNANRKAIIEDIQVVGFPGDPLYRILTPAEWQTQETNRKK